VEPSDLIGKQLSLIIMGEVDDEEDEWPVLTGIVEQEGERLVLARPDGAFPLRAEWLERVRIVDPRVQGVLLGADYVLPLRIGDLPASATPKQLHDLKLKPGRNRKI
jgi:hypothetical protein